MNPTSTEPKTSAPPRLGIKMFARLTHHNRNCFKNAKDHTWYQYGTINATEWMIFENNCIVVKPELRDDLMVFINYHDLSQMRAPFGIPAICNKEKVTLVKDMSEELEFFRFFLEEVLQIISAPLQENVSQNVESATTKLNEIRQELKAPNNPPSPPFILYPESVILGDAVTDSKGPTFCGVALKIKDLKRILEKLSENGQQTMWQSLKEHSWEARELVEFKAPTTEFLEDIDKVAKFFLPELVTKPVARSVFADQVITHTKATLQNLQSFPQIPPETIDSLIDFVKLLIKTLFLDEKVMSETENFELFMKSLGELLKSRLGSESKYNALGEEDIEKYLNEIVQFSKKVLTPRSPAEK